MSEQQSDPTGSFNGPVVAVPVARLRLIEILEAGPKGKDWPKNFRGEPMSWNYTHPCFCAMEVLSQVVLGNKPQDQPSTLELAEAVGLSYEQAWDVFSETGEYLNKPAYEVTPQDVAYVLRSFGW